MRHWCSPPRDLDKLTSHDQSYHAVILLASASDVEGVEIHRQGDSQTVDDRRVTDASRSGSPTSVGFKSTALTRTSFDWKMPHPHVRVPDRPRHKAPPLTWRSRPAGYGFAVLWKGQGYCMQQTGSKGARNTMLCELGYTSWSCLELERWPSDGSPRLRWICSYGDRLEDRDRIEEGEM